MSRRDLIIKAASEVIHINGFNNTSIENILTRSGVKKGNFYFYFKSKEELGFAVIEHALEEFQSGFLEPVLSSSARPMEKLMTILDGLEQEQSRANCHGGCPFGNMALELSDMHDGFRRKLQEIFLALAEMFGRLLREASDELKPGTDLQEVSQLIVAGLEGGIMLSKVHKSILPMQQCVRQIKHYLRSLRAGTAISQQDNANDAAPNPGQIQ